MAAAAGDEGESGESVFSHQKRLLVWEFLLWTFRMCKSNLNKLRRVLRPIPHFSPYLLIFSLSLFSSSRPFSRLRCDHLKIRITNLKRAAIIKKCERDARMKIDVFGLSLLKCDIVWFTWKQFKVINNEEKSWIWHNIRSMLLDIISFPVYKLVCLGKDILFDVIFLATFRYKIPRRH